LSIVILVSSCAKKNDDGEIIVIPPPTDTTIVSNIVEVTTDVTAATTWKADKIYLLKGNIFVTNDAVLTIEPGTIIKGDKASKAALIVTRGAKIEAVGTVEKPIVFTSNQGVGAREEGDWGGIILLGKAHNNGGTSVAIEGISDATDKGKHGGENDDDNSGTLKYVRIEYAGVALSPDNEINGLTFGSVGRGTTIDYVQVYRSGDDAFEFFGGTVNAKHLLAIDTWDDDFDTDNGYSGHIQFGLAQRLAATADVSGSNGFESDNNSGGTNVTPRTSAVFSNMTILGPKELATGGASINPAFQHGAQIRRNSAISILNSVIVGYTEGVFYDDAAPVGATPNASGNLMDGSSVFANNIVAGSNSKSNQIKASSAPTLVTITAKLIADNTFSPDVYGAAIYADPYKFAADIAGGTRTGVPSFILAAGSPAATGALFTNSKLEDAFFDKTVAFKGAFGTENWAAGWANFAPQTTPYTTPGAVN
ncbi:MAG: hypothetical protein EOP51_29660, partial [Sphingobacteriales bacterium]